jgi:hypothetical protein
MEENEKGKRIMRLCRRMKKNEEEKGEDKYRLNIGYLYRPYPSQMKARCFCTPRFQESKEGQRRTVVL